MRSFAFSRSEWSASSTALVWAQVDRLLGAALPGQRDEPVEIGARDGVLGGRHGHLRQAVELAPGFLEHRLGHAGGVDLLAQLLDLARLVVALAELLLDGLHLLAQQVLALVLAHLGLHLRLDARAELEDLQLLDEEPVERVRALADVQALEHLLLGRRRQRAQARGDEVGELGRVGDVGGERLQVVRQERRERHDLLKVRLDVALERVDLEAVVVGERLGRLRHARAEEGLGRHHLLEPQPHEALHDQAQAAVGQLEHLVNVGRHADRVQVGGGGLLHGRVALREHPDQLPARHRVVDEAHGALPRHGERHERVGKQDRVPKRKNRQLGRHGERPVTRGAFLRGKTLVAIAHGDPPGWAPPMGGAGRPRPPAEPALGQENAG